MKRIAIFAVVASMTIWPQNSWAVENNAELAAYIMLASKQGTKALNSQQLAQDLMMEGHVWIGAEVQKENVFLREFNDYLDTFHEAVGIAAELYGTYLELKKTIHLTGEVSNVIADAPMNAVALMLTPGRNGIYSDIITSALQVGQDIYNACIAKQKLTEQDRHKMLTETRLKVKRVNRQLSALIVMLHFTNIQDILKNITQRARFYDKDKKSDIIRRCMENWMYNTKAGLRS